jgi:hypothetical protein
VTIFRSGFVRSPRRLERLDETALSAAPEVRVLVRALLGPMPELGLDGLHGLAARDGLARHRMPPVVAEQSESELLLHELQWSLVAVDVPREGAVPREEEFLSRRDSSAMRRAAVAFSDSPRASRA